MSESHEKLPDTSRLLAAAAEDMAELEARIDALVARVAELEDREATFVRDAYRRGYRVGWGTGRNGGACVTNPERKARGWVREVIR